MRAVGCLVAAASVPLLLSGCGLGGTNPVVTTLSPSGAAAGAASPSRSASADGSSGSTSSPSAPPAILATPVAQLSPADVVTAAQAAVGQHTSVHVTGTGVSDGVPLTVDLRLVRGKGGTGTIASPGKEVRLLAVGDDLWVRAGTAFWAQNVSASIAARVSGHWAHVRRSSAAAPAYGGFTDYDGFLGSLLQTGGSVVAARGTTVDGHPTVAVRDGGGKGGTLYVRSDGDPLPVRLVSDGTVDLVDWDADVALTPPPAADVVELA